MKRSIKLLPALIITFATLSSCSMEYQISHPHVPHQKNRSDRWAHSQITMIEELQSVFPQTASAPSLNKEEALPQ